FTDLLRDHPHVDHVDARRPDRAFFLCSFPPPLGNPDHAAAEPALVAGDNVCSSTAGIFPVLVCPRLHRLRRAEDSPEKFDGCLRSSQAVDVEVQLPGGAERDRRPAGAGKSSSAADDDVSARDSFLLLSPLPRKSQLPPPP